MTCYLKSAAPKTKRFVLFHCVSKSSCAYFFNKIFIAGGEIVFWWRPWVVIAPLSCVPKADYCRLVFSFFIVLREHFWDLEDSKILSTTVFIYGRNRHNRFVNTFKKKSKYQSFFREKIISNAQKSSKKNPKMSENFRKTLQISV